MKLTITVDKPDAKTIMELAWAAHKAMYEIWTHACSTDGLPEQGYEYGSDAREVERNGASWRITR